MKCVVISDTHGSAGGILDQTIEGDRVGCEELAKAIKKIRPKFHICGHIHEGYGTFDLDGCTYINASVNTHQYKLRNQPIVFEI